MTKADREEFEAYYRDLKADAKENGYRVNKADELERFKAQKNDQLTDKG